MRFPGSGARGTATGNTSFWGRDVELSLEEARKNEGAGDGVGGEQHHRQEGSQRLPLRVAWHVDDIIHPHPAEEEHARHEAGLQAEGAAELEDDRGGGTEDGGDEGELQQPVGPEKEYQAQRQKDKSGSGQLHKLIPQDGLCDAEAISKL